MPQNPKSERKSGVTIPTEDGPAAYGTPESADALAPVWGMSPGKALRLMMVEQGHLKPEEADMYDRFEDRDAEAPQVRQQMSGMSGLSGFPLQNPARTTPTASLDALRNLIRSTGIK